MAAEVSYNNAWYTFGGGLARKNVTSKSYTPFGEQIGEVTGGFGYNGEYYNAATGMIYLRARFYEPEMNRFSQKDTLKGRITDGISLNRYLYCQNDPVNFADYNGLQMVAVDYGVGGSRSKTKTTVVTNDITKKNQPPTYKEFSSQSGYDPLRPSSMWSSTGSNSSSNTQKQQGKTTQSTGITQTSPSVQSVTGNRGYSCGRERVRDGAAQIIKGAFYVGVGIAALAVASTAGLPVILALAAAAVTTGTVAYGANEMGEGIDSIIYGSQGDTTTATYNPLRDGLFGGNQDTYDTFGYVAISGSFGVGIIAPEWEGISSTASNLWNGVKSLFAVNNSGAQINGNYITTPYGIAVQSETPEAGSVIEYVSDGGVLYRAGTLGRSQVAEAQFWAPESPFGPDYADRYGVAFDRVDFIIGGTIKDGTNFITRAAPGLGNNIGGAVEIVTDPNSVNIQFFYMP